MSNAIPPILVQIAADVSQLKAGLAQAQSSIKGMDSTVQTANTGMQNMIGTAKKMAGAMGVAFAATQVVQFGKDVIMSASSMQESISKVNVVFGQNAEAIFKFGDAAAKSMGMSNQSAIEAAGTYGNLFQAFGIGQGKAAEMSTTLVQLAADLGSFNNTSTEEAINALRSGLSGETEPLKRFGVAINETTLKAKAMAMGFGEIKGAMDPAIKAQVTYALVMEQTKLAQGDYARTADGTANTMKTLAAQFADAKVAVGDILLPAFNALLGVLKLAIPILKSMADFVKKNKDIFESLAIGIGVVTVAFVAYKAIMIASTTATKLFAVAQVLMKGGQLASIASTNTLAASMLRLNAIMYANPIGLIVAGIALLIAGFVLAYKKSETFRNVVGTVAKAVLSYVAFMIRAWGDMITIILKVVTGPLKLFLGVMSKLPGVGGAAKAGLKLIDGAIEGVGDFAEKTATKIEGLKGKVDAFTKSANESAKAGKNAKGSTGGAGGGGAGGGAGASQKETAAEMKKRIADTEKALKSVAKVYADMDKVYADAAEKTVDVTAQRDKRIFEAHKQYNEAVAKADNQFMEASAAAHKRYNEQVESINNNYSNKTASIEKKYQEQVYNLRKNAAKKTESLIKQSTEKQESIIQQSRDRLRNAFASKTGFNLAEVFGDQKTLAGSMTVLKKQLEASKNLARNAGLLQGKGFSQTFIEQVVSAGPEVGNQLAESILSSSPEAIAELQATFKDMEETSKYGLDALAQTMNSGANLATKELMDAYTQVGIDLQDSLLATNEDLLEALLQANEDYKDAMLAAKIERDEAMLEAQKTLREALEEADKNYKEALAEALKNLTENLEDIQTSYLDALDQIKSDTEDRISDLKAKLVELGNTLKALGATQAAISAWTPPSSSGGSGGRVAMDGSVSAFDPSRVGVMTAGGGVTINQTVVATNTNTSEITNATIAAVRYGMVTV